MSDMVDEKRAILSEDAIVKMIGVVLQHKRSIIRNTIIGCVLGVAFALGVPKQWTSTVVLAPESEDGGLSGQLGSMAAMVGVNIGSATEALYPELYPQIIESKPFVTQLFDVEVMTLDGTLTTTLYDYLSHHQQTAWYNWPKRVIGMLLQQLVNIFFPDKFKASAEKVDPFYLSKDQEKMYVAINDMVRTSVDKRTQVITINVEAQDALIAAVVADTVQTRLQTAITEYRTKKAQNDVRYAEKMKEEKYALYQEMQKEYAAYVDAHRNRTLQSANIEEERLGNEVQFALSQYSNAVELYNNACAKLQERTPSFTVLQPSSVERKPSSTPKIMVMLLWAFMLCFGSMAWYVCRDTLKRWKELVMSQK